MSEEDELLDRVWDDNADPFATAVRVKRMTERRRRGDDDGGAGVRVPLCPTPTLGSGAVGIDASAVDDART